MRQFAPAEPHRHFDLVAFLEELRHTAQFNVIIVIVDTRAQLDLFDLDDLLLFACLVLFLLFFVFVFAEVEDFADRRVGVGRNFDQIKAGIGGHGKRFVARNDPNHIAPIIDQPDAANTDFFVDPRPLAGGGQVHWWSWYLNSPLFG
jgi:hypothetical protein